MTDVTMHSKLEATVAGKVARRLIPFLFLLYVSNFLDRVNVSFAALQFKGDLHLSDKAYGLGAGMFFIGYFFFEVPSNLVLERVGARMWIARIMVTWGIISSAMMFVHGAASFYTLRFLLGVAEAGFFPGIILYLTYWFTRGERAKAVALFMTAGQIAGVIGGPLAAALLRLDAVGGLKGWQWLFLVEGIPSVLLGFVVLAFLTDRPEKAHWLSDPERAQLLEHLGRDHEDPHPHAHFTLAQAFAHPTVLLFCLLYFLEALCGYGNSLWGPQILQSRTPWSNQQISVAMAIPPMIAAICMVFWSAHSDRMRERRWHLAIGAFVSAVGMAIAAWAHSPVGTLIGLSLATAGLATMLGPFWASATTFLPAGTAAGGIAFINSVGNLGGFVGPYLMGAIKEHFGSFTQGLLCLSATSVLAGCLALVVGRVAALERTKGSGTRAAPSRRMPPTN